jgi:hypothetical protein
LDEARGFGLTLKIILSYVRPNKKNPSTLPGLVVAIVLLTLFSKIALLERARSGVGTRKQILEVKQAAESLPE